MVGWVATAWVVGLGATGIHVYTIILAFLADGIFSAVMVSMFPVASQVYWFVRAWQITGSVVNGYSVVLGSFLLLCVVMAGLAIATVVTDNASKSRD
jgi:hypothetical protein